LISTDRRQREETARRPASSEKGRQFLREQTLRNDDPRVRATALAALAGTADDGLLKAARNDPSADVRELAARLLPYSSGQLLEIARADREPAVQAAALERLTVAADDRAGLALVLEKLKSDDPFLQAAAREALRRSPEALAAIEVQRLPDPAQQAGVLLALRAAGAERVVGELPQFLRGADPRVQFIAVQWIGEARLKQHRAALLDFLNQPSFSGELFAAAMTALALIDGAKFDEAAKGGQVYLEKILADPAASAGLKQQALRRLDPASKLLQADRIKSWIASEESGLRLEAVRSLRASSLGEKLDLLATIAQDEKMPAPLRAEAAAALGDDAAGRWRALLGKLAGAGDASVRHEALRSLRGQAVSKEEGVRLAEVARLDASAVPLIDRLVAPDRPEKTPALQDTDAWLALLAGPADAAAGERIFFHAKSAGCYRCHRVNGRGSDVGPDLSLAARNLDRRRLVESILQPGKEVAPQYTTWTIATKDGRVFAGMLVQENEAGEQTYADPTGRLIRLPHRAIEARQPSRQSLMPEDLARGLTVQEFRDLLAFLGGAGEKPAARERQPEDPARGPGGPRP
jgi:putative heme-binding domain-containing protein